MLSTRRAVHPEGPTSTTQEWRQTENEKRHVSTFDNLFLSRWEQFSENSLVSLRLARGSPRRERHANRERGRERERAGGYHHGRQRASEDRSPNAGPVSDTMQQQRHQVDEREMLADRFIRRVLYIQQYSIFVALFVSTLALHK